MTPIPLILTTEERRSPLWRRLVKHWEHRLDDLRKENDRDKNDVETANLRGRIADIKENLGFDKDLPVID